MEVYLIVASIILLLIFAAVLVDVVPIFRRWLSRIHIGRWQNTGEWETAVKDALLAQLKKTPRIPLSDNERLTVIEKIRGQYSNASLQMWQQAALLLGANSVCACEAVKKEIGVFIDSKINPGGDWREFEAEPETAMLAFAILSSPDADKKRIKPAMDRTAEMLFDFGKKYGTVPYNSHMPDIRFVDTIGMICPFLTKYAVAYDCIQALAIAKEQIQEYAKFGLHERLRIPVHCCDIVSGAPLGIYGWGRGCGWWAVGLMDTYLALTDERAVSVGDLLHDEANIRMTAELKELLLREMTAFANTLASFQMKNGAWDRQIFLMNSGESSATAMIARYMKNMYAITRDEKYALCAEKAAGYLMSVTKRNGVVDSAQGDTRGIGNYSQKSDSMPAVQGFTVRFLSL